MSDKIELAPPILSPGLSEGHEKYDEKNTDAVISGAADLDHVPAGEDVEIKKYASNFPPSS